MPLYFDHTSLNALEIIHVLSFENIFSSKVIYIICSKKQLKIVYFGIIGSSNWKLNMFYKVYCTSKVISVSTMVKVPKTIKGDSILLKHAQNGKTYSLSVSG